MNLFDAIFARRSINQLERPAPTPAQLTQLWRAAAAAPDHGELRPWRFVVVDEDRYPALGEVFADAYLRRCAADGGEPVPAKLAKERTKLSRAPMVIVVGCRPVPGKIPEVEQLAAVAAATQNLLLAATALGLGTMWRTGPAATDPLVRAHLGFTGADTLVGFLYIGTVPPGRAKPPKAPEAPEVEDEVVRWWLPDGAAGAPTTAGTGDGSATTT